VNKEKNEWEEGISDIVLKATHVLPSQGFLGCDAM
jgi:hypothetical protein